MKNESKRSALPGLGVLLVFALTAVCMLLVLLTGGSSYRRLAARDRNSFDTRTVCQYIATRVRQADRADAVALEDFQGCQALVLGEEIHGKTYLTRVYCYEGKLMELYTPASGSFSPADGEALLDLAGLSFQMEGTVLTVLAECADGGSYALTLTLRSGQGGAL